MSRTARFEAVRAKVAALEAGGGRARGVLPFGDPRLDGVFPAGGLPLGCWHEVAGEGLEMETAASAGAFVAALAGSLSASSHAVGGGSGVLVWVMRRGDLYAPGLAAFGLSAERLIQVRVRNEADALGTLEDALGSAGVVAAIGEIGGDSAGAALDLTAGRRLQLACERRGGTGFVIRRRIFGGRAGNGRPAPSGWGSAAATHWSVAPAPSAPEEEGLGLHAPGPRVPGLGAPRWRVTLNRCRGGRPGAWILEMSDAAHPLRVVARLGDRQLETTQPPTLPMFGDGRQAG